MKWALEKPTGRGGEKEEEGKRKTTTSHHSLVGLDKELVGPAFQTRVLLAVVPPGVQVSAPSALRACEEGTLHLRPI